MTSLRCVWVGFHAEGLPALHALLGAGAPIRAVLTLTPELRAKRSGAVDFAPLCAEYAVPLHLITGINEPEAFEILQQIAPDVIFVIGWHQIVRPPVMRLARIGLVGAHASYLPHNRGERVVVSRLRVRLPDLERLTADGVLPCQRLRGFRKGAAVVPVVLRVAEDYESRCEDAPGERHARDPSRPWLVV